MAARILEQPDRSLNLMTEGGKETTYYPDPQIFVTLSSLRVVKSLEQSADEGGRPKFTTSISGEATMVGGSMAAIGLPTIPAAKVFSLGIAGTETCTDPAPHSEASDLVGSFGSSVGIAHLDFSPSDWELDIEDGWFLHLTISVEALAAIASSISASDTVVMEACLRLKNLYSRAHPMAPISRREDMFLRPLNPEKEGRDTLAAHGVLVSLRMFEAPTGTALASDSEAGDEQSDETAPNVQIASLLSHLAERVEQTRKTIKWVGGLLVCAVIFLALRTQ